MKKIILTIGICFAAVNIAFAQVQTAEEYVAKYKNLAMLEMRRMGVPAAITLAQGLLETENGNSELFKESNNHFGVKCKKEWTGAGVAHDDDAKGECFRVYKNAAESYRDHSNFLRSRDRYAFLFKLDPLNYKAWAHGLKNAGYATNPRYPEVLIKNIEQYDLQQYSLDAMNDSFVIDSTDLEDSVAIENDTSMNVPAPETELKTVVNGIKCVYAAKGTSLLAIATDNNINLNNLLEYNDLTQDGILNKGQLVFLDKKARTGDKDFCTVVQGETLYDISQEHGIQLQYLLLYNELRAGDNVVAGTKLFLAPHVIQTPVQPASKVYEVQSKEGLFTIAKKNGVTMQQLRDWNHLDSDSLTVGQKLIIAQ